MVCKRGLSVLIIIPLVSTIFVCKMSGVSGGFRLFTHILSFAVLRCLHAVCATQQAAFAVWALVQSLMYRLRRTELSIIRKPPAHLGIVIGECELSESDAYQLAKLVSWCVSAGIYRLTICDVRGELASAPNALCSALQAVGIMVGLPAKPSASPDIPLSTTLMAASCGLALRLISLQSGRDDMVRATRRLCSQVG